MKVKLLQNLPNHDKGKVWERRNSKWYVEGSETYVSEGGWLDTIIQSYTNHKAWFEIVDETPEPWRAEEGYAYYLVDNDLSPQRDIEQSTTTDTQRHIAGNYFRTLEQAEVAAAAVQSFLTWVHNSADPDNKLMLDLQAKTMAARNVISP